MQKLVVLLCTTNKQSEREINKTTSFVLAIKKYLGINLTKKVKNLYTKNCKRMLKEILKDTYK